MNRITLFVVTVFVLAGTFGIAKISLAGCSNLGTGCTGCPPDLMCTELSTFGCTDCFISGPYYPSCKLLIQQAEQGTLSYSSSEIRSESAVRQQFVERLLDVKE